MSAGGLIRAWRARARELKQWTYALYLAYRDPRVPWYARAWAIAVVAYAFSPIDLIPDVIPVLGHLDDLVLIPLGIWVAIRLIPPDVLAEAREQARNRPPGMRPAGRVAAGAIVALWLGLAGLAVWLVLRLAG